MRELNTRADLRIALLYAGFGGLWILFSDTVLIALTSDVTTLSRLQTYKGWAFVASSALLIFALLRNELNLRKRVEDELRASEKRYRLISENSTDVIWTLDPLTQRFTYVSPSVFALRGLTVEEVMAEPMEAALTPDSYRMISEMMPLRVAAFMAGDTSLRTAVTEVDQTRKDGSIVPTEVVTTLLTDEQGHVLEILGITRNIAERKQAEAKLERQLERFKALHLVYKAISSSFDLPAVFHTVLQQVTAQLGVDACAIRLFHFKLQTLEYVASRGFSSRLGFTSKLGSVEDYASRAILERKTIRFSAQRYRHSSWMDAPRVGNEIFQDYMGVPLMIKGEVKGVLEIYQHTSLPDDAEWLDFLETLAEQTAIAIDHVQMFKSSQQLNLHRQ